LLNQPDKQKPSSPELDPELLLWVIRYWVEKISGNPHRAEIAEIGKTLFEIVPQQKSVPDESMDTGAEIQRRVRSLDDQWRTLEERPGGIEELEKVAFVFADMAEKVFRRKLQINPTANI
jgi:hypothetical protein